MARLLGIVAVAAIAIAALVRPAAAGDDLPCVVCVILLGIAAQIPQETADFGHNNVAAQCTRVFGAATPMMAACTEMLPKLNEQRRAAGARITPEEDCFNRGFCSAQTCNLWGPDGPRAAAAASTSRSTPRQGRRATDPETLRWVREAVAATAAWRSANRAPPPPEAVLAKSRAPEARGATGAEWKWENLGNHLPVRDDDDDWFSPIYPLRGAAWRGRDCDDLDGTVYPGRQASAYGPEVDHDCNGIFGVDGATGVSFEEQLCGNSSQMGVIVLGDSISAHFHVPIYNLTAGSLLSAGLNELDFPQCSWGTGFAQNQQEICMYVSPIPTDSIYLRLRERNLCNHRDYQDISRNGARSSSMQREIVQTTSRRSATDRPSLVWYGMIANDVCNGHPGTGSMTGPEEYRNNTLVSLAVLDTLLAPGSTVVLMGHIHGELMWDSVAHKQHIIGVTYGELWNFLGCYEENPCWSWLNADPAWRQAGTDWAQSLTAASRELAATAKFNNFNLVFVDSQDEAYVADWIAAGGDPADLYEIVDGGHPSLIGESLMARYLWEELVAVAPSAVGPVNPNNDRIRALFGDQGGH